MAHVGIVNLAERLLNQSQAQTEGSPQTTSQNQPSRNTAAAGTPDALLTADQFTASAQGNTAESTAQAAGLFSVNTLSLFTAAAKFILGLPAASQQNTAATANATPAPAVAGGAPNASALPVRTLATNLTNTTTAPAAEALAATALTTQPPTSGTNAQAPDDLNPAALTAAATAIVAPTAIASTFIPPPTLAQVVSTNTQLQSLNDALAALGLSPSDITVVDRVASALQDYNPTTYTNLVYQLEALAQAQASPAVTTPAAAPSGQNAPATQPPNAAGVATPAALAAPVTTTAALTATNPSTAATFNSGIVGGAVPKGSTAGGGLQLQGLVIRFAASNETPTLNQTAGSSGANTGNPQNAPNTPPA